MTGQEADFGSQPDRSNLSAEDLRRFCEFLYQRTGILYGENKRFYIERRLAERMKKRNADVLGLFHTHSKRRCRDRAAHQCLYRQ